MGNVRVADDPASIDNVNDVTGHELFLAVVAFSSPGQVGRVVEPEDAEVDVGAVEGSDLEDASCPCFALECARGSRLALGR